MRLLPFQFAAFSPVFGQTLAGVQFVCMCHRHLELMKTCQASLSVQEDLFPFIFRLAKPRSARFLILCRR